MLTPASPTCGEQLRQSARPVGDRDRDLGQLERRAAVLARNGRCARDAFRERLLDSVGLRGLQRCVQIVEAVAELGDQRRQSKRRSR